MSKKKKRAHKRTGRILVIGVLLCVFITIGSVVFWQYWERTHRPVYHTTQPIEKIVATAYEESAQENLLAAYEAMGQQSISTLEDTREQMKEAMAEHWYNGEIPENDTMMIIRRETENNRTLTSIEQEEQEAMLEESAVEESTLWEESVSGNSLSGNSLSGNSLSGNTLSGNSLSENSLSGNSLSGNSLFGNSLSENSLSGNSFWDWNKETENRIQNSLENKRIFHSSMEETKLLNSSNQHILDTAEYDFTTTKIACLGDSITEGSNLEDPFTYSYPSNLQHILDAEVVYNLGIGGSSISRGWDHAFVDRYTQIPEDTDIILVLGGVNDGFAFDEDHFGNLVEKKPGTFCGDLDELMRGLKEQYPNSQIVFITPLPNVLHDYLQERNIHLLDQGAYVNVIWELSEQYDIPVLDLYNSNLLDSHDAQVLSAFVPDGVHPNEEGYEILARHIGAWLVNHPREIVETEND